MLIKTSLMNVLVNISVTISKQILEIKFLVQKRNLFGYPHVKVAIAIIFLFCTISHPILSEFKLIN